MKDDVNYDSFEQMKTDLLAQGFTIVDKVRKIRIALFHRKVEDPNATDFRQVMPPAGTMIDIVDYTPQFHLLSIAGCRNKIIEWAIRDDMTHVFFVDDDVIVPKDALISLLKHNADIAAGVYYRKHYPLETAGMNCNAEGFMSSVDDYKIGDVIHNTFVIPAGCSLLKIEAMKKIDPPWYRTIMCGGVISLTEDAYFGYVYRRAGIDAITDTSVQCLHVDSKGILYGHPEVVDAGANAILPKYKDAFAFNGTPALSLTQMALNLGAMQKGGEFDTLLGLLKTRDLKTVVEIGTGHGGSLYAFCQVASPDATIVTIDLPDGEYGGKYVDQKADLSSYKKGNQKLHFLKMDSHDEETFISLLDIIGNSEIDFLFIDGDHSYEGVKKDWVMYSRFVKRGGLIAFHDICEHSTVANCEVNRFWNEIKKNYKTWNCVDPSDTTWGGIGILEYEEET
jgi:predicted O-methyltransferase YrrM